MFYEYVLNECEQEVGEPEPVRYGISCMQKGKEVSRLTNLSSNKERVEELVEKCNQYKLDPIQLSEIAEDYLK